MTVLELIVETNFVVDVIRGETHCSHLFEQVEQGNLKLIVPEICLLEAQNAVAFNMSDRTEMARRCHFLALEFEACGQRSKAKQHSRYFFQAEKIIQKTIADDEKRRDDIIQQCRTMAGCLPLTPAALLLREHIQLDRKYGTNPDGTPTLQDTDALIYAIILDYIENRFDQTRAVFFTRDQHFDTDFVREELDRFGVEFSTQAGEIIKKIQ